MDELFGGEQPESAEPVAAEAEPEQPHAEPHATEHMQSEVQAEELQQQQQQQQQLSSTDDQLLRHIIDTLMEEDVGFV